MHYSQQIVKADLAIALRKRALLISEVLHKSFADFFGNEHESSE